MPDPIVGREDGGDPEQEALLGDSVARTLLNRAPNASPVKWSPSSSRRSEVWPSVWPG